MSQGQLNGLLQSGIIDHWHALRQKVTRSTKFKPWRSAHHKRSSRNMGLSLLRPPFLTPHARTVTTLTSQSSPGMPSNVFTSMSNFLKVSYFPVTWHPSSCSTACLSGVASRSCLPIPYAYGLPAPITHMAKVLVSRRHQRCMRWDLSSSPVDHTSRIKRLRGAF